MSDLYSQISRAPIAGTLVKQLGLPQPVELERWQEGRTEVIHGPVLFGAAPGGRLAGTIARVLADVGAEVHTPLDGPQREAAAAAGLDAEVFEASTADEARRFKALVFDASGIQRSEDLDALHAFFSGAIRRVMPSGRVIVLGTPPEDCTEPRAWTAQRALEGLTRSLGKEVRRGSTSQLVYVAEGGEEHIDSTLWFLLSPKSAYVSAQVIRIRGGKTRTPVSWNRPLEGSLAVVTGASRGIGEAIAEVLARDGARVLGIDIPPAEDQLRAVTDRLGGTHMALDITAPDAPRQLADRLEAENGADVIVHNAGITRDKTLGRMKEDVWKQVIDVNLSSQERIDDELLKRKRALATDARIVTVSSISGIAGNAGQTNYATSKAGVIGMVQSMAPVLAKRGITINAVAPGFIETQMTAAMPFAIREAGRRMNSMSQGGRPVDVAEAVAWFAGPSSSGVTGNVVRVCGQSLLGA